MKIGKWYITSDFDLYIFEKIEIRELKNRIKNLEKINYEQYKENYKLKKENEWLKNHQKIEILNLEE